MTDKPVRWSAKKKAELVLQLLRGESIDVLSRENCLPVSIITEWRDQFLEGGLSGFKRMSRQEGKLAESQKIIGKLQMELELYKKKMQFVRSTRKGLFNL